MDMSQTVAPKSDQLNADDMIAGPRTIRITRVSGTGNADQPVAVYFEGDDGKPYKPCKSMRRVMIAAWGVDAAGYVGRGMTLYRDPQVQFGGMAVGGIRISHMTDIAEPMSMALTVTKAKRATFRVQPLHMDPPAPADPIAALPERMRASVQQLLARLDAAADAAALDAVVESAASGLDTLRQRSVPAAAAVEQRIADARARHAPAAAEPGPGI